MWILTKISMTISSFWHKNKVRWRWSSDYFLVDSAQLSVSFSTSPFLPPSLSFSFFFDLWGLPHFQPSLAARCFLSDWSLFGGFGLPLEMGRPSHLRWRDVGPAGRRDGGHGESRKEGERRWSPPWESRGVVTVTGLSIDGSEREAFEPHSHIWQRGEDVSVGGHRIWKLNIDVIFSPPKFRQEGGKSRSFQYRRTWKKKTSKAWIYN